MDFTQPLQPSPISSIPPSSAKLPIKRKNPTSTSTSNLILTTPLPIADDDDDPLHHHHHDLDLTARHPPFKFHRIWTNPDEIRFLQGLLHCSSQGLSFPRDLGIFYARFSHGMSQPYSKSQLSEKLRRLRKKFRVISSRLSQGLDKSLLSPQDRALYDLSKQLWEPSLPTISICKPITHHNRNSNFVGVKPSFSQTLPSSSMAVLALPSVIKKANNRDIGNKSNNLGGGLKVNFNGGDVKLRDVKVELGRNVEVRVNSDGDSSREIVHLATKALADVLDRSLKETRIMVDLQVSNLEKDINFERRWRDQHMAEFDVLAKRMKLIVEHSSVVSK